MTLCMYGKRGLNSGYDFDHTRFSRLNSWKVAHQASEVPRAVLFVLRARRGYLSRSTIGRELMGPTTRMAALHALFLFRPGLSSK